ncbi:hypothetical protein [Mesorhizobium sp.]|uniref:hypothetical protein n=1 Tax=Mesorhizobium sp. TaxID=1871066 RepID=UPI00122109A9|nr:hypothetical protein [Mesorhizobium sp.]TIL31687.1 MAG: hypothetical protein E5Y82_29840 [Mesorhizobium sp.]
MELLELDSLRGDIEPRTVLRGCGWRYGSTSGSEEYLRSVPQNIPSLNDALCQSLPDNLKDAASYILNVYNSLPHKSGTLFQVSETVFLGPAQTALMRLLTEINCKPIIVSGYRSPPFQSLLLCARYFDGTLVDAEGRYSCLPPGFSDHNLVDGALDIENSEEVSVTLSTLVDQLPCSVYRPYLFPSLVCSEPWHWRTINCSECVATLPNDATLKRSLPRTYLQELIQFFDENYQIDANHVAVKPEGHVFVKGFDVNESVCFGSKRQTFLLSLADANAAVGSWPSKIVTVPLGFTPLMNGEIADYDVGSNIFELASGANLSPTFITPFSCVKERVNTPSRVVRSLEVKAGLKGGDRYSLSQSLADEWLIHRDAIIVPVEYGVPRSGYYRIDECSKLLSRRFDEWLCSSSETGLPPYMTREDGTVVDNYFDVARYSLLACYIAEGSPKMGALQRLQSFMTKILEGVERDRRGSYIDGSLDEIAGIVFIARFFFHTHRPYADDMLKYWQSRIMSLAAERFEEKTSRIFLGHFANLLLSSDPQCLDLSSKVIPSARTALSWVDQSLLYSLAAAQILRFRHLIGDPEAYGCANQLISRIVRHTSPPARGEFGAFSGLETFQSALPIEAVSELWTMVNLPFQDQILVARRLRLALRFLSRCQFDEGVGALSKTRRSQAGAVSYSLIDRHCRIDYGVHASRAARFLASMERQLDATC